MKVITYGRVEDPNHTPTVYYNGVIDTPKTKHTVINNGVIDTFNPKPRRVIVNGRLENPYDLRVWINGVLQPSPDSYTPREKLKYVYVK